MDVMIKPKWSNRKIKFRCRPDSSDTDVIKEVIERRCYRKPSIGLTVEEGEHWLDLGANIGTFAALCYLSGATATCYEPEPTCFGILKKNAKLPGFKLINKAVTVHQAGKLPTWRSKKPDNFYRGTVIEVPAYNRGPDFNNVHVATASISDVTWDGVKIDIEGSELPMIDEDLLPKTDKLALEYHFSRDGIQPDPNERHFVKHAKQMQNFHRRMGLLRKLFDTVSYPPSLNKHKTGPYPGRFDIIVHCVNR